jgi:hypothetical protein
MNMFTKTYSKRATWRFLAFLAFGAIGAAFSLYCIGRGIA